MDELSNLKEFLLASIKKNGDKPLTLQHLVNIIRKMEKNEDYINSRPDIYDGPDWDQGCRD